MKKIIPILFCILFPITVIHADEKSLDRNDLSAVKKKLQAVLTAIGTPPAGYSKNNEDFNIPTKYYTEKDGFQPMHASAEIKFGGESSEKLAAEFQKKMMEAQARGDAAAMQKLSMEMQSKAMASIIPEIEIEIKTNNRDTITADPDKILMEKPGILAIITNTEDNHFTVKIYFDPKSLKDSSSKAEIDIEHPDSIKNKTGIANISVEIEGPEDLVRKWIQKIQLQTILTQIDVK